MEDFGINYDAVHDNKKKKKNQHNNASNKKKYLTDFITHLQSSGYETLNS